MGNNILGRPGPCPAKDTALRRRFVILLDFPNQRLRCEAEQDELFVSEQEVTTDTKETRTIFDGKDMFNEILRSHQFTPLTGSVDLGIVRKDSPSHIFVTLGGEGFGPLFYAHGLMEASSDSATFNQQYDAEDYHTQGQAQYQGKGCMVIRTFPARSGESKSFSEFWIDPTRENLVLRHLDYLNDHPSTDSQITYQQSRVGWLPLSWARNIYINPRIALVFRYKVDSYEINPRIDASTFSIGMRPGMTVKEHTGRASKLYRVATNGSWVPIVDTNQPMEHLETARGSWFIGPLGMLLGCTVILGLIAFWFWRRRKLRPRQPAAALGRTE
jgi:hypothetical protein